MTAIGGGGRLQERRYIWRYREYWGQLVRAHSTACYIWRRLVRAGTRLEDSRSRCDLIHAATVLGIHVGACAATLVRNTEEVEEVGCSCCFCRTCRPQLIKAERARGRQWLVQCNSHAALETGAAEGGAALSSSIDIQYCNTTVHQRWLKLHSI
jgi:hypothetical protein